MLLLLGGCAVEAPPRSPQVLRPPPLSAAEIAQAERHAYDEGYAAGRRYQKQQDQLLSASALAATAAVAAADGVAPLPAPAVPVLPAPPPAESYAAKGPAKPVATPVN